MDSDQLPLLVPHYLYLAVGVGCEHFVSCPAHGPVDEVQVEVVDLQSGQRPFRGCKYRVWGAMVVPCLRDEKKVLPRHLAAGLGCGKRLADRLLVRIKLCAVEMPVTSVYGRQD